MVYDILNAMHIAYKFEHLLNTHRWPDGHRWTGQQMLAVGRGPVRSRSIRKTPSGRGHAAVRPEELEGGEEK
jgi:hypothetical protein